MKYIDVLVWGIKHIAQNHNFNASTDYEDGGSVCIYGGCNVPTLQDAKFLCEDLKIESDCIESSEFGIDVWITQDWYDTVGQSEYKPTGLEMWKRKEAEIGK